MSAAPVLDPDRSVVEQLRERVAAMQRGPARLAIPTLPALAGVVPLHAGATIGVDSASLALALAAGASAAGEWVGFAGWPDFGAEAAVELGVELSRTVLVPDPGEHWLEVTAALVDVLRVVVLRPPAGVDARTAGVLDSRLRSRSSALVVWGDWPRCEARVCLEDSRWVGAMQGAGRLRSRRARLAVRRGGRLAPGLDVVFPGESAALVQAVSTPSRSGTPLLEASG